MSTDDSWEVTPVYGSEDHLNQDEAAGTAQSDAHANEADDGPQLYFASLSEFVGAVVVQLYRRHVGRTGQYKWSARWWNNPEAVTRLEAMWRAWEHLRLDPATGTSTWLLAHGDPHMRVLLAKDGPFALSEDSNRPGEALPFQPAPPALLAVLADSS